MQYFNKIDANRVKLEARYSPMPDPPKTGSAFGRFLRSFGALAAPVGFASAFFFPPAALVGASAYGLGQFGAYRDASRRPTETLPPATYFPGVTTPTGGPGYVAPVSADPIDIISNRQSATNDMIGKVK